MFLALLSASPAIAFAWVAAILVALTVHEFSHALVGKWRGDDTAERMGRLTLNPLAHLDPLGFVALLLIGFGWAKPVPYNPYNLRDSKWDAVLIALAGPASNVLLAAVSALAIRFLVGGGVVTQLNLLVVFLFLLVLIDLFLAFFNFIPVAPLDGSKLVDALFAAPKYAQMRMFLAVRGPQILLGLVLLSYFTPFDVFGVIAAPAYGTCNALFGHSCTDFLGRILGGG